MFCISRRLELTGFIKEVRHNKHGSLTGLSLEDIVASVSDLVEQKKKVIEVNFELFFVLEGPISFRLTVLDCAGFACI